MKYTLWILALLLCSTQIGFAQNEVIKVNIIDKNTQEPLIGAVVEIGNKYFTTNSEGVTEVSINRSKKTIRFEVSYLGYKSYSKNLSTKDIKKNITIALEEEINALEQVVVSSEQRRSFSENQVVKVVDRENLEKDANQSLAKILSSVAGVSMIQSGNAVAKPVIHGMHSNRILILNNEVRQEGQQWGADHAPEIDALFSDKINIVKGADAIRYGSDALGGVIILEPSKLPYGKDLSTSIKTGASSNALGGFVGGKLESSFTKIPEWAWQVEGNFRRYGDASTADYVLNNTGSNSNYFAAATGIKKQKWNIEAYYSRYHTENGVFYGSHIGNLDDLMNRFKIGRPLRTFDATFEITAPKQAVTHHLAKAKSEMFLAERSKVTLQYAYQYDIRKEFNVRRLDRTQVPALDMRLQTHTLDAKWEYMQLEKWKTELGINYMTQENFNQPGTGVVPVIPNFASVGYGIYGIEKYLAGDWSVELGVRYDYKNVDADGFNANAIRYGGRRKFHNFSYNLGGNWKISDRWTITSNAGLAWRAPHVSELYSNGLHHGAGTYEIGDENLVSEKGLKWVNSIRYDSDKFSFETDLYIQKVFNYIYDSPTKKTRTLFSGVYPIFQYQQANAFFRGVDITWNYNIIPYLYYKGNASVVYANDEEGGYFPFIPSERFSQEIEWRMTPKKQIEEWFVALKHSFTAKQTHFDAETELVPDTPDSYHLFGADAGVKFKFNKNQINVYFSVDNMFDTLYKEYTNRFRFYAHDVGRNFKINISYKF